MLPRGIVILKQKRAFPNCSHKVGSTESLESRMSFCLHWKIRGLAQTMKQPQTKGCPDTFGHILQERTTYGLQVRLGCQKLPYNMASI
uniref:Uncharacterized protein n=1 Tax=Anguilla anguilla TaxID=7936 RepID=A0A0E9WMV6_ANGAN